VEDSWTRREGGVLRLQTTPQLAAQALRTAIISGELKPGDRILEQKWSSRLGIGQPTLREAMFELEHQGLLRKQPQRGTYVTQLSSEDYQQIQEVRIPLEAIAIGRAAERLTVEHERTLAEVVRKMKGTDAKDDVKHFHDCDVLFHRTIWEIAGNPYLAEMLETITFRLFVFSIVGRWPNKPGAARERLAAVKQHENILRGLRTKDGTRARQMFLESTVNYWNKQYGLTLKTEHLLAKE
jgi:DNA-binding GntR family transcriptional regulator